MDESAGPVRDDPADRPHGAPPEQAIPALTRLSREEAAYAHLASFAKGQQVIVTGRGLCREGTVTTAQQDDGDIERAFLIVSGRTPNALARGQRRPDPVEVKVTVAGMLAGPYLTVVAQADAATGNSLVFDAATRATPNGDR